MRSDLKLVSKREGEPQKVKHDLAISAKQNEVLFKKLETKEHDVTNCMRQLSKLLDAQSTLNTLTSQPGNIQRFGFGYIGTSTQQT